MAEELTKGFGERLRQARKHSRMTQTDLGVATGTRQQYINKAENGDIKRPTKEFILKAGKALNVSPAWLLFGLDELEELSKESIDFARDYEALDQDQRLLIKGMVQQMKRERSPD